MDSSASKLRATRPNKDQKLHLLQFLEDHTELANDKYESSINGAHDRSQQWSDLAVRLNSMNGANKTGEKWRKYWQDQRSYVKERNAIINLAKNKTGVHSNIKELSEYEKRVTALITIQAIVGDTVVIEFGDSEMVDVNLPIIDELPSSATIVSTIDPIPSNVLNSAARQPISSKSSSYKKRKASRNEEDDQFNKFLQLEERKLQHQKEYKQKKIDLMEKIAKKQNELDEAKIDAINNLKEAIININK